jgi:hypothetical protein
VPYAITAADTLTVRVERAGVDDEATFTVDADP